MSRSVLRILAVTLTTGIIVVGINALDHLPGSVRAQIDAERAAFASAQGQVRTAQAAVTHETQGDAAFFGGIAASRAWPGAFQQAQGTLQSAGHDLNQLSQLEQHGHYRDRDEAERLLNDERRERQAAVAQAAAVQADAARWTGRKAQLPAEAQRMEQDYQRLHAFDLAPLADTVEKAETKWPEKKTDLDARLASVRGIVSHGDELWQSTAADRRAAAAGTISGGDSAGLLTAADELDQSAATLPKQAAELQGLTGQLDDSWDKILVDMEARGYADNRDYEQKIRTVRTHQGETTSQEQWVSVSRATFESMQGDLGMAVEHKPAGKYDSEADRVAQPAGFAYVAPPSQGSNQYGYWDQRNGESFWVFYGKYALLRDLLFNYRYRPLGRGDWDGYRAERSQGHTYYGQSAEAGGAPKYGTNGTATEERYSGSTYAKKGGFRDSPYATKGGSYRDSPYASPAARDRDIDHSPKTFGRNARPEEPRGPPAHSYRPAPHPEPRRSPGFGGGRRFGRRH